MLTPAELRAQYERDQARDAWRQAEQSTDAAQTRAWLERAHRFAPGDQNILFALALARLAAGDADAALASFDAMAARQATREVLCGQAAACLALGRLDGARAAVARALAECAPDQALAGLADRVCALTGLPGWVGVSVDGTVAAGGRDIALDGKPVTLGADGRLPPRWRRARRLEASVQGTALLGSPVDLAALRRVEGVVERTAEGIAGWAWHPAAPETDPVLTIHGVGRGRRITATDLSAGSSGTSALARPRGFSLAIDLSAPVRVLGADGRDLLGSPLGGDTRAPAAPRTRIRPGTAVVIPVYRGRETTLACVRSVLATVGPDDRVLVVNDASPEPALIAALHGLTASRCLTLMDACPEERDRNQGFVAAANAGMAAAGGRNVVLLNSDTLVFPGWLAALCQAAHSAPDIGTATPLSNDATIFSYPDPAAPAPMPAPAEGARIARLAAKVNAGVVVDSPTGHGFCLYIRADCLRRTGLLNQALFAQGYGEENDFTERARALGWRHVAVPGVYVAHVGGASFGAARAHLLARNAAILDRLHADYLPRVQAFMVADPLFGARRRLDTARWRPAGGTKPETVLLFAHGGLGGTARVIRERAEAARAGGLVPVILRGNTGKTTVDGLEGFPNLAFDLPTELAALRRLLAATRPVRAEIHHLRDQDFSVLSLLADFALPYDVWVHDYLWLCPRLSLVTGEGRFCGEAPATQCVICVAAWGDGLERPTSAAALRAISARLFAGAGAVVTPSTDVAARLKRHFPTAPLCVRPWEDDPPARAAVAPRPGTLRVAVVGAIGLEKGFHVLVACARDAAARGLSLHFHVVGYTEDDTKLLETGHASITGVFKASEAQALIQQARADIAFLPSIWPETWCYALSDAWRAGLDAAVFDIGTPAERVRRTGRGWVLPLNLPPARVNDALLNLHALAGRSAQ